MIYHSPVLLAETIKLLDVSRGKTYIDATLGNGGHTIEILKNGGTVHGFDQDPSNLEIATSRISDLGLSDNFYPINRNFNQIGNYIKETQLKVDGVLFDLGLSSNQQKSVNRGFSFNDNESLDMRLDPSKQDLTAEEIVNTFSAAELYDIFSKIGQEPLSQPLIRRIITSRQRQPIKTGQQLSQIIKDYYQERHIRTSIDPSTKIFMSLRIVVNQEYDNLKTILNDSVNFPQHCIVVFITFHSGEDRLVKLFIKSHPVEDLTPKPIRPGYAEIKNNPLSRSATLRSYRII